PGPTAPLADKAPRRCNNLGATRRPSKPEEKTERGGSARRDIAILAVAHGNQKVLLIERHRHCAIWMSELLEKRSSQHGRAIAPDVLLGHIVERHEATSQHRVVLQITVCLGMPGKYLVLERSRRGIVGQGPDSFRRHACRCQKFRLLQDVAAISKRTNRQAAEACEDFFIARRLLSLLTVSQELRTCGTEQSQHLCCILKAGAPQRFFNRQANPQNAPPFPIGAWFAG